MRTATFYAAAALAAPGALAINPCAPGKFTDGTNCFDVCSAANMFVPPGGDPTVCVASCPAGSTAHHLELEDFCACDEGNAPQPDGSCLVNAPCVPDVLSSTAVVCNENQFRMALANENVNVIDIQVNIDIIDGLAIDGGVERQNLTITTSLSDKVWINGQDGKGGLSVEWQENVKIENVVFLGTFVIWTNEDLRINDTAFFGCSGVQGGALQAATDQILMVKNTHFHANTASYVGGAAYGGGLGSVFSDVVFSSNAADDSGGAYMYAGGVTFRNTVWNANTANNGDPQDVWACRKSVFFDCSGTGSLPAIVHKNCEAGKVYARECPPNSYVTDLSVGNVTDITTHGNDVLVTCPTNPVSTGCSAATCATNDPVPGCTTYFCDFQTGQHTLYCN